jgi:hypothetical protein
VLGRAFQAERRERVFDLDVFRFGTATGFPSSSPRLDS